MRTVFGWKGWGILLVAGAGSVAVGCEDVAREGDVDEAGGQGAGEHIGAASQPLQQCVTIRRGATGNVTDTFLSGDYPTWVTGNETNMHVGASSGGNVNRSLIDFELSPIPEGSTIQSATLSVNVVWNMNNTQVTVHPVLASWAEATTTAANFPAGGIAATPVASFFAGDVGTKSVDVTSAVQGWFDGSLPPNGLALQESSGYGHVFFSSEVGIASRRPALTVCYEPPPVPVSVGFGAAHACALLDDGQVKCWGQNTHGQLGYGDTTSRGDQAGEMCSDLAPVDLGTGRTAVALAVGAHRNCALLDDGKVKCWGRNSGGALGLGDTDNRGDQPGEMGDALPVVDLGSGNTAVALAVGSDQSCALLASGQVKCWGGNSAGALGLGDTDHRGNEPGEMGDALPAVDLGTGRTAVKLVAGAQHTCALLDDASVKCWGYNVAGQLGQGHTGFVGIAPGEMGDALPAVELGTGLSAQAMAAGTFFSCAIVTGGGVKCWGLGTSGQLGQGNTVSVGVNAGEMGDALALVDLGTGRTAVSITAGGNHACAVLDDGTTKCWGQNAYGQLGLGDTAHRGNEPGEMGDALPAVDLGTGRTAVSVAAGASATCARLDNGKVKCWGRGTNGQLGLGDTAHRGDNAGEMGDALPVVPVVCVAPPPVPVSVGAGTAHACALLDTGKVKCWGQNTYGQLGYGDTVSRGDQSGEMGGNLPAVDLGAGRSAVALAVGTHRNCALLDNGKVKCWGRNSGGALGLGDTDNRGDGPFEMGDFLPYVDLGAGHTAVALTVGLDQSCALLASGQVKCWGGNSAGALGLGDTDHRGNEPGEMGDALPAVDLGTGRTAVKLVAGAQHTCALLDDASVKCWGYNVAGQLGQGHTGFVGIAPGEMGDALPAVELGTGLSAQAMAAGTFFSCAIVTGGGVKCWGLGTSGQLGQGNTVSVGVNAGEMGDALALVDLGTGRTAVSITAGGNHACAVLDDGTTKCWGQNAYGQLGLGDTAHRGDGAGEMGDLLAALDLGTGRTAVALTAGASATCALLDNDALRCWGRNSNGQLGLGDTAHRGDGAGEMGDALPVVKLHAD